MENIDVLKMEIKGAPKYKLSNANVFVSTSGFHYIDYLDPAADLSQGVDESELSDEDVTYIENSLQSNSERFENQANIVNVYMSTKEKKLLDIGCGGGLFLSKLKATGTIAMGIELSDVRIQYAKTKHDLEIIKRPIEDDYWQSNYSSNFDAVTLWDVIEHVNYPLSTLLCSTNVLKSGGFLFIDTPCRDSFYHRFGEITYRLTNGKFPTFLNAMYSAHRFGHKQIFSTSEMKHLFELAGLEVIKLSKFHELSFPYSFYLKKILKSDLIVKILLPVVHVLLFLFPIKNKMLVIGRKRQVKLHNQSLNPTA